MATRLVESNLLRLLVAADQVVQGTDSPGLHRRIEKLKAAMAGVTRPKPLKALVVVWGGNAEVFTEPGVHAVVADLDNLKCAQPGGTVPISKQYAALLAFSETEYPISDSAMARLNDAQELPPK